MKYKYIIYLIDGVLFSVSIMLGTAIGAKSGNIRSGLIYGLLAGSLVSAIINIFVLIKFKNNQ